MKPMKDDDYLSREISFFYYSLFSSVISDDIKTKYIRAHEFIIPSGTKEQFETINKAVHLNLDIEAIELALRRKNLQHPLLQKMKIMTYLLECDSHHYHFFINEKDAFLKSLMILFYSFLHASYKLLKGKLLVWRHKLV
jgi:hypothetical protein